MSQNMQAAERGARWSGAGPEVGDAEGAVTGAVSVAALCRRCGLVFARTPLSVSTLTTNGKILPANQEISSQEAGVKQHQPAQK
jgi:hypothetical protein